MLEADWLESVFYEGSIAAALDSSGQEVLGLY